MNKHHIAEWFNELQDRICAGLESLDGGTKFQTDQWEREGGGGGRSRIIQKGNLIEKGGVGFSAVYGVLHPKIQQSLKITLEKSEFFATGVSIVLHPYNPYVPIIHMNVRYFELSDGRWWFGGGIDVTPHYVVVDDAVWFHRYLKRVCDEHHPDYYAKFKKWADDYFYLPHRQETRGIGGIFFDRLVAMLPINKEGRFDFVKAVGESFLPIYSHLANAHRHESYGEKEMAWQLHRRSRYVEFNLVYDQGTKFGLDSNGRTESILMSMPPLARWEYNYVPEPDTPEAHTQNWLRKDIEWVSLEH
ncbi:MAG TPA: oxygen-dependent coproporphyrinogen oxidase [Chitinophagales bacterium]|nr:oxygen-dependent coproporphyrinogen oxidase [Chitinophagales bacterium]